ncbi:magnesium transporter NIPA-domain-containing protein [Microdochium bolleyi]|uniref:Magnesium transporter NIPA-domain-containing protein n=1 Tax=Microdochium bolleyi TaxID=196109 RepID=A0A136JB30_9PEZI|nr:magnesium transporter NIPA-domain-containing protein [Microdochium bolleyi]
MALSSSAAAGLVDQSSPSSSAMSAISSGLQGSLPDSMASPDIWTWAGLLAIMGDDVGKGLGNWSSLIGIITAICGNVLIALALNVQRYSHIQLNRKRTELRIRARQAMKRAQESGRSGYGSLDGPSYNSRNGGGYHDEDGDDEAADADETHPLSQSFQSTQTDDSSKDDETSSSYLKSPSWWIGQVLMTVGEMGNFLAYGFAPASIVSPLGVVALISNCVIAPIFFGEQFRGRDFWGVVIAVLGAVTVVLSAKTEETKLEPHDVWDAITTTEFEVYLGVTVFFIVVLMWASPRYGNRTILIDLGLVGLFGGYTALTTKGVSSMLSSTLWRAFTTPVTYGLLVVLLGTAVMQVRYVNKALQRFDSTQVIPVQFVTFTLSVIIGSAVLYRDFENATAEQATKFAGGCALTFFGVFLITSGRHSRDDDEDHLSDDDDVEETIGLRHRTSNGSLNAAGQRPAKPQQHPSSSKSSRRPSLGSRGVSFADEIVQSGGPKSCTTVPSARNSESSAARPAPPTPEEPLSDNPWQTSLGQSSPRPAYPSVFISSDSIPTYQSDPSIAAQSDALQSTKSLPAPSAELPILERPITPPPRPSMALTRPHGSHYSNKFISPSPLSSTVTAVVGDSMRGEPPSLASRKSNRRLRPGIRNSLFVPYDEDDDWNQAAAVPPARSAPEDEPLMGQQTAADPGSPSPRRRANSLGATLENIFGRKKKKRSSTIDTVTGESRTSHDGGASSGESEPS